ncbi:hypothetical protein SAMN05192583_0057 [Sphingomonas gellani]|uniref:Uncharacterized protein n=1 Tax=Sphingomonas gellani TaxID=1166340 RepID=A0A1H7Y2L2_9SPHN|nr:hypothetical protein [Sphingomonas gellani]SEM40145.1 hypothetical protein SAMN05192583_0057 [Sphingomonas gellani]
MNDHISGSLLAALIALAAYKYLILIGKPVTPGTRHANLICGLLLAASFTCFVAWNILAFGGAA